MGQKLMKDKNQTYQRKIKSTCCHIILLKIDVKNIKQNNDFLALAPLQFNLQNCLISEYEFDDYFENKQRKLMQKNQSHEQNEDPDITQLDFQIKIKKQNFQQQNVFKKIIQIQQLQIQYMLWKDQQQKHEQEKLNQSCENVEQAIKRQEHDLKKSKLQLKQLKEEIKIKENIIEEIQKTLMVKTYFKCKICPKMFEKEENLKSHHKRNHPGILEMHYGDLNYKMIENIQQSKELIQQRMNFSKQYFAQEKKRIEESIEDNVLFEVQKKSTEFKQELLDFHQRLINNHKHQKEVVDQFQQQNNILQQQVELLYSEFGKIQNEIQQAEIQCINAYIEKEKERIRREQEEKERIEKERKEEEERQRKIEEEQNKRIHELEALKKQREADKKKKDRQRGSILSAQDKTEISEEEQLRLRILKEKQEEEEERLRILQEQEQQRIEEIQNTIKKLKNSSKSYFNNFNRLVNIRRQNRQNYTEKDFNEMLSTKLFEPYDKILERYKIPLKMSEITVRSTQITQLEEIYLKITGGESISKSQLSSQTQIGEDKLVQRRIQKNMDFKRYKQEQEEVIEEEQEAQEKEYEDNGKRSAFSKSKMNPLFKPQKQFYPYFKQPIINPKLNALEFRKEKDVQHALSNVDTSDLFFAIGITPIQKPRIIGEKIDPKKNLNQNIQLQDQNPLKIDSLN
ncbi:zinc finger, C2H2 type family protein (macronuclear) [Tetrahymena thermophila SB210]|uniref:Zinc finger, C2H2 type family protein n=1 Tax=Tetrahymena thermophila (strain SB210) TaxID=312017 RepID=Q22T47_TETTS|nr:zinc finger, C2H2 type family protein [Tetrahymena thermophila SB210]EAR88591.2 zinc finger, C2H2 type family protein [Tetrahymena thermophila SB210]|eukprot:XP_001008836.2 zinc finger, C2H2 type family protein [Tetrahymena thermophila SB210]